MNTDLIPKMFNDTVVYSGVGIEIFRIIVVENALTRKQHSLNLNSMEARQSIQ